MPNLTKQIHNAETNEIVIEELTNEEQTQTLEARQQFREERQKQRTEAATKRDNAFAKLEALGLNADDLKALGL